MAVTNVIPNDIGKTVVMCEWFEGPTKLFGAWLEDALRLYRTFEAGSAVEREAEEDWGR
jgi:hypothetical protein